MKFLMQLESLGYSSNTVLFPRLLRLCHRNYIISYSSKSYVFFLFHSFMLQTLKRSAIHSSFNLKYHILEFSQSQWYLKNCLVALVAFNNSYCGFSCERTQFSEPNSRGLLFQLGPHGQSCQGSHIPSGQQSFW